MFFAANQPPNQLHMSVILESYTNTGLEVFWLSLSCDRAVTDWGSVHWLI